MTQPLCYSYLRYSSAIQGQGDSAKRQTALSQAYADRNNLTLDNSLFLDAGVSAFRSKNRTEGALSRFIEAVKDGTVPAGSFLLVESLDRLSRDTIDNALRLFLELLSYDITIVTLSPEKVYDKESSKDLTDLIVSLTVFARANEESQIKSDRVRAATRSRRQQARESGRPIGNKLPSWLSLSADKTSYQVIEARAAIVQRLFTIAAEGGRGGPSIALELTREGVATLGSSRHWNPSTIARILMNRAVLGELQPHTTVDGKRVPDGPVIANHFPAIIEPELFAKVQKAREGNTNGLKGRKGKSFSNLFSSIALCPRCGSNMRHVKKVKGLRYLVCNGAKNGSGLCKWQGIRYDRVEQAVLASMRELDWQSLIANSAPDHKLQTVTLQARLTVIQSNLKASENRTANLIDAIAGGGSTVAALIEAAAESEADTAKLTLELSEAQQALQDHRRASETARDTAAAFTSAVDLLATITNATDLYSIRAKVHALLGQLIEEMYCSLWQPPNDVQRHLLQMMPEQLQDLFVYGSIILVRLKLKEEVQQLKARMLLINPATGQVASFLEQVPEGIQQQVVTDSPVIEPSWLPAEAAELPWQQQLAYLTDDQQEAVMSVYDSDTFYGSGNPSKWTTFDGADNSRSVDA